MNRKMFMAIVLLIVVSTVSIVPVSAYMKDSGSYKVGRRTYSFDIYYPDDLSTPKPAVVVMHGLIVSKEFYTWFGKLLAAEGYVTIIPSVPWSFLPLINRWSDCIVGAVTYLSSVPSVDVNRIGVIGHSMGGAGVLVATAKDARIKCTVALAPAVTFGSFISVPSSFTVPVQIQTGTNDWICSHNGVVEYYNGMTANPKELVIIEGGDHMSFCDLEVNRGQHAKSSTAFLNWFTTYL